MATAAYLRRNARARALGYRSYYDYRAHDNGKLPPDAPRLRGARLRRARGHASAADLVRGSGPGTLVTAVPDPTSRQADGTYSRVYITAIDDDGADREYLLRGAALSQSAIDRLVGDLDARGAVFSPSPSLDVRRYVIEMFVFMRRGRYLSNFTKLRAYTTKFVDRAIIIEGEENAESFYHANQLDKRGFTIEPYE